MSTNHSLIRNVLVPTPDDYDSVDVQLIDDRIGAINHAVPIGNAPQHDESVTIVEGTDKLLLPGFVNAHTHSSQVWQRGLIPPLPLELWLADVSDSTTTNFEQIYLAALRTAVDVLLSGGTCIMDHAYLVPNHEYETVAAIVRAYKEIGIRAFIAPLVQDLPFVAALPSGTSLPHKPFNRTTAEVLEILEAIVQDFHRPDDGIAIAMGPTGFQRCSDALFEGCVELSDRYHLCRHTHLLETKAQQQLADERYGGSAVQHLQTLGFLDERTSLAHAVWLSDSDIEILASTRSTVSHNPVSNLRLGSGIAPVLKYRQAGVNVAFGCDGSASNDSQNLLEVIKLGTILHSVTDLDYQNWITPRQAIDMATMGGATGLNLADHIGSLTIGKKADCVLYDLNNLSMLPYTDPIGMLVLGRPTNVVDSVWVNGKRVVAEGSVQTIDVEALRQELIQRRPVASRSQFQTIQQIEAHYRQIMLNE